MRTRTPIVLFYGASLALAGCKNGESAPDMAAAKHLVAAGFGAQASVAEIMRAAIEMQQSGEPLAEAMGRDLNGYDRNALLTDQYTDPATAKAATDLVGYSTAVESYEYSKYMMNAISFESGAGISLEYGPLINMSGQIGDQAVDLLRQRVQALAVVSHAGVDSTGPWVIVPAPAGNPLNLFGFPGLLPEFAEFSSYAPDIAPSGNVQRGCTFEGGYGSSAGMAITVGDYECGYNSLHIDRTGAMKSLDLDALGFAAWKQALWVINYFQVVHDVTGAAFTHVADVDIPQVGGAANTVRADNNDGSPPGMPGTYVGSSDLEGFQGMLMATAIDNKAVFLLQQATTTNGVSLGGFASTAAALNYDYNTPLRFFPHSLTVSEQPGTGTAEPRPTGFGIKNAESHLADLSGLLGAYAEAFALTDRRNPDVGGSSTTRVVFDGFPFATDNGNPDGEATLHDRSLAVLKTALVNLDRMHTCSPAGVLCDTATFSGGAVVPSDHVSTVEIVQAMVALRAVYRSLTAQLTLYGNATPDTAIAGTALDATSMAGSPGGATVATRLQQIIKAQADFLLQTLVSADGLAKNGASAGGGPDPEATTLDAQAAAVRGLLEAYLSTSSTVYRDRAEAAYKVLEQQFYVPELRVYQTQLGEKQTFVWTPIRFASLQAALRQMYVLVGSSPGQEALRVELEDRLGRLNKLILNGWDDRDGNGLVDSPAECLRVSGALPRGGLMLAERSLTGELGSEMGALTSDRDRDCVPEIDDALLTAQLAGMFVLAVQ